MRRQRISRDLRVIRLLIEWSLVRIQPGEPFGCSFLFFLVRSRSVTLCKSITFRLRPCRDGSAPFAHISHFFGVSVGVSPPVFRVSDGVSLPMCSFDILKLAG